MGDPMSAIKGVASLAGGAGGKGGGGSGGRSPGASPEQAALAQYHYGQNLLAGRSGFAGSGTGESTMATQVSGGARNQFAKELAGASDVNQQLQASANQSLQALAQQQASSSGFAAGASSGGFGSTGGSFSSQPTAA